MQSTSWQKLLRQTIHLTVASLKSRYRKTVAGLVWVVLNPLILFGVQAVVFKQVLKLDVSRFHLFLLSGLLPWVFLTQTVQMGTPLLVSQGQLLKSFRFHPLVLVAAQVLDNLINFFVAVLLIGLPIMLTEGMPVWRLLFLPLCLIPFVAGGFALTILTSLLHVFFRDTSFVLNFCFGVLFFITPIFYPLEFMPEHLRWLVNLNPLYQLLLPFRTLIYADDPFAWVAPWCTGALWALGLAALAQLYWQRKRTALYTHV